MTWRTLSEELTDLEHTDPGVKAAAEAFERMKQVILEGRQHAIPCHDSDCYWHGLPAQELRAISLIAYRMDPERAPDWSFHRQPPQPFVYDPARQVVHRRGEPNGMLWTCFPIHDPVWRMT